MDLRKTVSRLLYNACGMSLRDAMAANEHKELTLSNPEVVERVAQAEREFSVYQEPKGAFVSEKARESANKNAEKM